MHGQIQTKEIERLRGRIGTEIVRETMPFYTEISSDSIRHYAHAIGDDNPLWLDADYARQAGWNNVIGLPSILYATNNVVSGAVEGMPGVHAMFAGTDWTWHTPIELGTKISTKTWLKDLVEHETRFAGTSIQQIYAVEFYDHNKNLIAEADSWCFRTERDSAREEGSKYSDIREPYKYSPEEMAEIAEHYRNEKRRGNTPRYYDDVNVGDEIDPIVKGPYTVTSAVAYMQAWGSYAIRNHRIAFEYYDRHPKLAILNPQGVPEPPVRVHWDNDFAREVGVPGAYDFGPERISWLSHLLTDWIGDHGFLRKLNAQVRGHNLVGDTTWCRGRVTAKRVADGRALVDCEVWGENQRGKKTVIGTAVVDLPRKGD